MGPESPSARASSISTQAVRATHSDARWQVDLLRHETVAERVQVQARQLTGPGVMLTAKLGPSSSAGRVLQTLLLLLLVRVHVGRQRMVGLEQVEEAAVFGVGADRFW